jgi:hypothetical protein
MKLVIITQTRENYGAHDWDGVGTCPQYWKNKGGSEYIVDDIEHFVAIDDDFFAKNIKSIVYDYISPKISVTGNYFEENIINYSIEDNDYIPEYEKDQLAYEGFIRFYEPRITIDGDIIARDRSSENSNIVMSDN